MSESLSTELIKDVTYKLYPNQLLAGRGELLRDHALASALVAVAVSPKQLINYLSKWLGSEVRSNYLIALTGILHDWGKSLPTYQNYLRFGGKYAPIRHEVTTFIVLTNLLSPTEECEVPYLMLTGSILYHHHGLYDFVESIVKYLAGHRVWPKEGVPKELISRLVSSIREFLINSGLSSYFIINEEVVSKLRDRELSSELLEKALEVEGRVNQLRNVVTPLLTQLMIADNAAASATRDLSSGEGVRLILIARASAPVLTTNLGTITTLLINSGLSRYAEGIKDFLIRASKEVSK